MSNIFLSIIVPAYNEEKNIRSCLLSLVNQKSKYTFEVILVDNNSTDKTYEIGKKIGVRIIRETKQGRPFARQKGAEFAKGEILVFTEADCLAPSDWIDKIGNYFVTHSNVIGLAGKYKFIDSSPLLSYIGPKTVTLSSFIYRLFTGNNTLRGTNFAIRKSIFNKVGKFRKEASPLDDVDYGFRASKFGQIDYLPSLWVYTQDRRIRGRLMKFVWEFTTSFITVFFLKKPGGDNMYIPIR